MQYETWVHGNSMSVEHSFPVEIVYRGFAGVISPPGSREDWPSSSRSKNFFVHFSIPVTHPFDGTALGVRVNKIVFSTDFTSGSIIDSVSLHDGGAFIRSQDTFEW